MNAKQEASEACHQHKTIDVSFPEKESMRVPKASRMIEARLVSVNSSTRGSHSSKFEKQAGDRSARQVKRDKPEDSTCKTNNNSSQELQTGIPFQQQRLESRGFIRRRPKCLFDVTKTAVSTLIES